MNNSSSHLIQRHANEAYEERVARHLYDAEVRRLLGRPSLRARLAAVLHRLADRVDPRTAPLYPTGRSVH
ncbi:hypothetical protein [Deinococcus apachensis]|uniref:hypothetical protein n=1 Tax=Deinococcus apachensis TaxID=309886 RepID=UPI0003822AA8|nr:hypothetical protein [Deinococcus apachensis]